jgi:prevent-host-death family protein
MPKIMPSSDLRNKYNEVSEFCREYSEPVYITKNGEGDLAVLSIGYYEELSARIKLYHDIIEGLKDIDDGKTISIDEAFKILKK